MLYFIEQKPWAEALEKKIWTGQAALAIKRVIKRDEQMDFLEQLLQ